VVGQRSSLGLFGTNVLQTGFYLLSVVEGVRDLVASDVVLALRS